MLTKNCLYRKVTRFEHNDTKSTHYCKCGKFIEEIDYDGIIIH